MMRFKKRLPALNRAGANLGLFGYLSDAFSCFVENKGQVNLLPGSTQPIVEIIPMPDPCFFTTRTLKTAILLGVNFDIAAKQLSKIFAFNVRTCLVSYTDVLIHGENFKKYKKSPAPFESRAL